MVTPAIRLRIHALLYSVMPPFSSFLIAVLSHYQIHTFHLDHSSLVLLSASTFLCEAFVGVTPSVALLRHFLSLELVSEEQYSGCVSLKTADASAPGPSMPSSSPKQWVQIETAGARALFQPSPTPATSSRGWMREEVNDPWFTQVLTRLEKQKRVG
ncbi:hypothetical protein D1007_00438 [Hordeum vulgare]|nr:hypothetical protein D1007_00438 [Hordeum vulgare]